MATSKSFTSLKQSKVLAEILPLESADTIWDLTNPDLPTIRAIPYEDSDYNNKYFNIIAAWSFVSLFDVLPEKYTKLLIKEGGMYRILIKDFCMTPWFDNPIDACVAMIEKLNELKML